LDEAGSSGSQFALAGNVVVGIYDTTTLAHVDSGAVITGEALQVISDDNLERISLAGGVRTGKAGGLGLSGGVHLLNRDTEAYIGNSRDQAAGTAGTSIHLDGPLEIAASSSGELWAFSLAGVFTNNPDLPATPEPEPGFIGPLPEPPEGSAETG